jgi:hypothetical protein
MSLREQFPTFQMTVIPTSSRLSNLELLDREHEGSTILRNVGNYSPIDTALQPRKLDLQQCCRETVYCRTKSQTSV